MVQSIQERTDGTILPDVRRKMTGKGEAMALVGALSRIGIDAQCRYVKHEGWSCFSRKVQSLIFRNDEELIQWLDSYAQNKLEKDPVNFLSRRVAVPELLTEGLAMEMIQVINSAYDRPI